MQRFWLVSVFLFLLLGIHDPILGQDSESDEPVRITVVGTNDLHGALDAQVLFGKPVGGMAWIGGTIEAIRTSNPGGVVLVDAGDLFQGSLLSNRFEGKPVVEAYNAIGYDAVAVGNHEFDFGPVGPALDGGDPRGALKARLKEATFPFLGANIADAQSGKRVSWPNFGAWTIVERKGLRIGIIGLTTTEMPETGNPRYLKGLAFQPLAPIAAKHARTLRQKKKCDLVIVTAHVGGFPEGKGLKGEIAELASALPKGLVDAIVGGHIHLGVGTRINGIPISIAYAKGTSLSRIELRVDRKTKRVVRDEVSWPIRVKHPKGDEPVTVDGVRVEEQKELRALLDPYRKKIARLKARVLAWAPNGIDHDARRDSPLGSQIADVMRSTEPDLDVAILNPLSIRGELDAGPVTFGELYDIFPIDNTVVTMELSGADLLDALEHGVSDRAGLVNLSGLSVAYDPEAPPGSRLVDAVLDDGRPIEADGVYRVATSDFLASGGDGFEPLTRGAKIRDTRRLIRDAWMDWVREFSGTQEPTTVADPTSLPPLTGTAGRVRVAEGKGIVDGLKTD